MHTLGGMATDLRTYSEQKIGSTWSREDHEFLLAALSKIDRMFIEVAERSHTPKGRLMRIDEILTMDPEPPRFDKHTPELPFDRDSEE